MLHSFKTLTFRARTFIALFGAGGDMGVIVAPQVAASGGGGLTPFSRKKRNRKRDEEAFFLTGLL